MSSSAKRGLVHTLVDVLLAFALCVVALLGWVTTYDGSGWLLMGLVGAGIGGVLALWLASRGWGADVLVILLIPIYLLGAGPVAGMPIGTNLFGDVVNGTIDSWQLLVGSHPFVADRGVLLLPPFVIALLTGGLATSLALRSRTPGAPLLPPLVGFAIVQVLGQHEPGAVLLHALGFAALAVVWMVLRGIRLEARSRFPALLTRLGLAIAVLAGASLVAEPVSGLITGGEEPRLVLREALPAYDVSGLETPLDDFRRFTAQLPDVLGNVHDKPLVTVQGLPTGARLRFAALDLYDEQRWRGDDKTVKGEYDDRYLRIGSAVDNPAEGDRRSVAVKVHEAWDSPWVPTAGAVQRFGFEGSDASVRLQELRYNPATATAVMTSDLTRRDRYEFEAVLPDDRLGPEMEPSRQLNRTSFIFAKFVELAAISWSGGAATPMQAVFNAAEVLRTTGRYSDGAIGFETKYLPGHHRKRLGPQFIYGSLTGNDEQYAALMALLATRYRVPARVVVGAVVPRDGVVRGRDVSAWVELRVEDGSWRTLPTEAFMSRRPPEADRFDLNPDQSIQLPKGTKIPKLDFDEPKKPKVVKKEKEIEPAGEDSSSWIWVLLVLLVVVLLAVFAVPFSKWWRRRRRLARTRVTQQYAGAWLELVDLARDLRTPVPAGLTRPAEALLIGRGEELAWEADRVIFGIDAPSAAEARDFWARVDVERRALVAAAGWTGRPRAWFSPASLRAPRQVAVHFRDEPPRRRKLPAVGVRARARVRARS